MKVEFRDLVAGVAKRKVKAPKSMGPAPDVESFVQLFAQLPDPRVERTRRHSLESILVLCLCAVVCGADDLVAIERFGKARRSLLERFVEFPGEIPSHDTIGRVLAKLDPTSLEGIFARWMHAVAAATSGDVVAIDGKVLRRAFSKAGGAFITMVSAWSTANGVILGQVSNEEGSNETTAIPRLLELLHIKGCLVTIDAAGCQKNIAAQIVDAGGDYLLAVRNNQPKLHAAVAERLEAVRAADARPPGRGRHAAETETSHGRKQTRTCWVVPIADDFPETARWKGIAQMILFESERTVDGEIQRGARMFITSRKSLTAKQALAAVRGHWQIENSLHWTLDVAFREDDSRLRADNAAENFAVVRHVALNLLRGVSGSKVGIKNRRLEAGWNDAFLMKVLAPHGN